MALHLSKKMEWMKLSTSDEPLMDYGEPWIICEEESPPPEFKGIETLIQQDEGEGSPSTSNNSGLHADFEEGLSEYDYRDPDLLLTDYLRVFPYVDTREISSDPKWGKSKGRSPDAETWFLDHKNMYAGLVAGHLTVELPSGKHAVGSATLISPPILENGMYYTYWGTALHVVESAVSIIINPEVDHNNGKFDQSKNRIFEVLKRGDRDYTNLFPLQDFSPQKKVLWCWSHDRPFFRGYPDVAFGRVTSSTADWPLPLQALRWPLPNPRSIVPGSMVLKLGYPGQLDANRFKTIQAPAITNKRLLYMMMINVKDTVLQENVLSAGPSKIVQVGKDCRIVKDEGSSWGGMSGGSTLNLENPSLLEGIHIGFSQGRRYNHFISVHHPFVVLGYTELLTPHLEAMMSRRQNDTKSFQKYFKRHKGLLRKAQLWEGVKVFAEG